MPDEDYDLPFHLVAEGRALAASGYGQEIRIRAGWTRAKMASCLGVSDTTIYHWERGTSTPRPHHAFCYQAVIKRLEASPIRWYSQGWICPRCNTMAQVERPVARMMCGGKFDGDAEDPCVYEGTWMLLTSEWGRLLEYKATDDDIARWSDQA